LASSKKRHSISGGEIMPFHLILIAAFSFSLGRLCSLLFNQLLLKDASKDVQVSIYLLLLIGMVFLSPCILFALIYGGFSLLIPFYYIFSSTPLLIACTTVTIFLCLMIQQDFKLGKRLHRILRDKRNQSQRLW